MYGDMCGGYCGPGQWSKSDQVALLKEREKILEAKLATIRHMIEETEKEKVADTKES